MTSYQDYQTAIYVCVHWIPLILVVTVVFTIQSLLWVTVIKDDERHLCPTFVLISDKRHPCPILVLTLDKRHPCPTLVLTSDKRHLCPTFVLTSDKRHPCPTVFLISDMSDNFHSWNRWHIQRNMITLIITKQFVQACLCLCPPWSWWVWCSLCVSRIDGCIDR